MSSDGKALALAYRFINRRERTVAEVRARLERAELPQDEIHGAIAELVELGYIDDRRFARLFVEDRRSLDGWGNDRIARNLRERGIDRELIEEALLDGAEPGSHAGGEGRLSEFDRAVALLEQRFPGGPSAQRDRERAFGVLARKGYESETAADAVRFWSGRAKASAR